MKTQNTRGFFFKGTTKFGRINVFFGVTDYFYSMKTVKDLMERSAFGVCSYMGDKMGLASARVRMYFIYLSFVALGSPIILYLFIAFWLNVKRYIKNSRNLRWE